MTKSIFAGLVALLLVSFTSEAGATCLDKYGVQYAPAAVADATGTAIVKTPTGTIMRIGGLPPFREVCRSLLFKKASKKCPSGNAVLDAEREPKFCKGLAEGHTCVHIRCNGSGT